jgi:hypothetical protein
MVVSHDWLFLEALGPRVASLNLTAFAADREGAMADR